MNGTHLIVELRDCQRADFDGQYLLEELEKLAKKAGMTTLKGGYHNFKPQGTTVFLMLEESHASLHTYPEDRYVSLDVYLCGLADPYVVFNGMRELFGSKNFEVVEIDRG